MRKFPPIYNYIYNLQKCISDHTTVIRKTFLGSVMLVEGYFGKLTCMICKQKVSL